MVYHGLPVLIYRGSTMVYPGKTDGIPWFTSFKIPWYTVVYHAFYHGLPVSKYHGIPWYKYIMVQFTMVQIHHGTIVPWYNVPWYTMVLFHKGRQFLAVWGNKRRVLV